MAMEKQEEFEGALQLGKKLVSELDRDQSVDTLSRWMAHYIAELMSGSSQDRKDETNVNTQIYSSILELWSHRYELPEGRRPFQDFEPIFAALRSIDPESDSSRYIRVDTLPDDTDSESLETQTYLERVRAIDSISKDLIDYCIGKAAEEAVDSTSDWVDAASKASSRAEEDILVIRIIKERADLFKEPDPSTVERESLERKLHKIEQFLELGEKFAEDLRVYLTNYLQTLMGPQTPLSLIPNEAEAICSITAD